MKKIVFLLSSLFIVGSMSSCKTAQPTELSTTSQQSTKISLEGNKVQEEVFIESGVSMIDDLNEDGTAIIKRPYKWFAGRGKMDNKQLAIKQAQSEAYATISKVLNNAVQTKYKDEDIAVDGKVHEAVTDAMELVSTSLLKACQPIGDVQVQYDPTTKMYNATAKVGIRGDRYKQLLETAGDFKPSNLEGEELDQFINLHKAIMEAAKGN